MSAQVLFTLIVPVSGALSDRGMPRVTTNIVIACVSGAIYVPTFLAFQTRSVVACWLLQALHLGLAAWAMGVLPTIVSRIYPAGVRISGFNLGHNLGEEHMLLLFYGQLCCFTATGWTFTSWPAVSKSPNTPCPLAHTCPHLRRCHCGRADAALHHSPPSCDRGGIPRPCSLYGRHGRYQRVGVNAAHQVLPCHQRCALITASWYTV